MKGWVKLHRSILNWEWYADTPTKVLFIHLLLKANREPRQWKGQTIGTGQVLTSRAKLSAETGLSEQQIRTSLRRLISTNELTNQSTKRQSLITVVKYGDYQVIGDSTNQPNNQQNVTISTNNQPSNEQEGKEEENKRGLFDEVIADFPDLNTPEFIAAWNEKEQHRKERRDKPFTKTGLKRKFSEFSKWGVPATIEAINNSIANNHQGVFRPSGVKDKPKVTIHDFKTDEEKAQWLIN